MAYKFSKTSKTKLLSCDVRLQHLFSVVVKHYDCTVICGHRSQKAQDDAYRKGLSKLRYPASKHNVFPSRAVDVAPYPTLFSDINQCYHFAGFVLGVAAVLRLPIRCGADFNMNNIVSDETFRDLTHFELCRYPDITETE